MSRNTKYMRGMLLVGSFLALGLSSPVMAAFSFGFVGGTLTLTQSADDGAITIDNNGAGNAFQTNDGSGLVTYVAATNLVVNLLDGTSNQLDFDLDNAHTGDVELNLGNGSRNVDFTGTSNSMGGNLTVTADTGTQVIEIGVNNTLTVGDTLDINLGTGVDAVDEDNSNIAVTNDFSFTGVNFFENGGTMTVGGNVTVDTTIEVEDSLFDDDATMAFAGDFTFTGGDGRDEVTMNGVAAGTSVGGNVIIDVGDNTTGGVQFMFFNLPNGSIGGTFTVISTSANHLDSFATHPSGFFGGDIEVDLGEGPNDAVFAGTFGGATIDYTGGGGVDNVSFGTTGNPANVMISLGAGDDNFALNAGASISPNKLIVNFGDGSGDDSFVNAYGQFDFDAQFLGLQGFNHIYTQSTSTLDSTQIFNSGPQSVNHTGASEFSFDTDNGTHTITGASNLKVTLTSDTNTFVVDLDNPVTGNVELVLPGSGRMANFTGTNNSIGGDLTVTGGPGPQALDFAVNTTIDGFLKLKDVNEFENNGTMTVGGEMEMDVSAESEDSRLDDDSALTVGGNLTYMGGSGKDGVFLNGPGGTGIGGFLDIDLGDNTVGGSQQAFLNDPGTLVVGDVTITSSNALTFDNFRDTVGASIGGNVSVDLGDGPNQATYLGTYGGDTGLYNGGAGVDTVFMGANGTSADTAMDFDAYLYGEDDFFSLYSSTLMQSLVVDLGCFGADTFSEGFAPNPIPFSFTLLALGNCGAVDFGDAPAPYPTLAASNGARHGVVIGVGLGASVDSEADGLPNLYATGDDVSGAPDEDGIVMGQILLNTFMADVDVTAASDGLLSAWVDFNRDGDWSDLGEQIFSDYSLSAGLNPLAFAISPDAVQGCTYARFRFSTTPGLSFTGSAYDGEVEDYRVAISSENNIFLFNKDILVDREVVSGNWLTSGDVLIFAPATVSFYAKNVVFWNGFSVLKGSDFSVITGQDPNSLCVP